MKSLRLLCLFVPCVLLGWLVVTGYAWLFHDLPPLDSLPERLNAPSVRILDRHGRLLYEVLAEEGGRHTVVPLDDIPVALRQATIATEDRNFYRHPGVDARGVLRALWINLRGGQALVGGSTITQQVARNLLMDQGERAERSLQRKLREMVLAWQLTRHFSKEQVLELYLNQTYYGGMAFGVEAAAQTYFGKSVSELDLAECALLAGLPQAPALYNPYTDIESARARQKVVLGLMEQDGYITAEQLALAERETLILNETPYPIEAPHFVMMVRAQLDTMFTPQEIYQLGGLQVRTTLDLDWQAHAERAIQRQLEALQRGKEGLGHNVNSAALVALDPQTGEILALVGSPDYFDSENSGAINMALSPRQPGSALKPLVYAAALDPERPGGAWTAATMLLDVRTSFLTHEGKAYTPENYDMREHGPVLVRQALGSSLNIPAVITLDHIGLKALFDLANKLGITTLTDPESYDLSLALGGGAVRLLELTAAYGAFANGGYRVFPQTILEVSNWQGEKLYASPMMKRVRVLDERVAWLISDILSDDEARLIGFGANSVLRLDRPAAVKTGTTSNFHDNWTVGYTPDLVVGVWSGNANYEPMREVNGLTGAAPIWHTFVRAVLANRPPKPFVQPPGLVHVEVCALSGLLPTRICPYTRWEWFINGTQPTTSDIYYREVILDGATGRLASETTPPERLTPKVVLDLPPQAAAWARSQGITLLSDLVAANKEVPSSSRDLSAQALFTEAAHTLHILSPASGSLYRLTSGLPREAQRIRIEAVGEPHLREVILWVDGEVVARYTSPPYSFWWPLSPGTHHIWAQAVGENGEKITSEVVTIEVK